MKKILITGGAGYLGSLISTIFLEKDYKITVLDNLMHKKNTLNHILEENNFNFIKGDVRDSSLYKKLIKENDIILPLAGIVGAPLCEKNKELTKEVNQVAIDNLCKIKSKDQIIIYPTTNSGYGITDKNTICTEDMNLNPISLYGLTKVNAEKIVMEKDNTIALRLATVFGTSYRNRIDLLVNHFTYMAVKTKEILLFEPHFRRNYIHIRDIVYTFEYCLEKFDKMKNQIYNVGLSEANLTKLSLCEEIKKIVPDLKIKISEKGKDPDKRDYFVSNEKIERTGWKTKMSFSEGIKELVSAYSKMENYEFDKNY